MILSVPRTGREEKRKERLVRYRFKTLQGGITGRGKAPRQHGPETASWEQFVPHLVLTQRGEVTKRPDQSHPRDENGVAADSCVAYDTLGVATATY